MPEHRNVDFSQGTCLKIARAILDILGGDCSRVDVSKDVKVYECKNVIRIDLKIREEA